MGEDPILVFCQLIMEASIVTILFLKKKRERGGQEQRIVCFNQEPSEVPSSRSGTPLNLERTENKLSKSFNEHPKCREHTFWVIPAPLSHMTAVCLKV